MRRYLFADFLSRALRFFDYDVHDVMNITDVGHLTQDDVDTGEDKLEREARERRKKPEEIATEQIELFRQDLDDLNIQPAEVYPKATEHVKQMLELIKKLVERNHAYITNSGVYFDVKSFKDYGKLSGNTLEKLEAGARVEVRGDKRQPADFALWKLDDPEHLQQWDSPWGRGYPGWHIECSAMAREHLGAVIDIHTGGEDNRFPHHENEIAQSEGAFDEPLARFWMHNRHLKLAGKKLAKRMGEQITLDTLKEKGYSPIAFRWLVFGSHYRSPMDFSWELLDGASKNLEKFKQLIRRLEPHSPSGLATRDPAKWDRGRKVIQKFAEALADDLNTPEALAAVMDFVHKANADLPKETADIWATLMKLDEVLGIFEKLKDEIENEDIPEEIQRLVAERESVRKTGDFSKADQLREEIEARGFTIEDTESGARVKKK